MAGSRVRFGDQNGNSDLLDLLADLIRRRGRLFVLTGAGCSTASGIPDYRGPDGRWKGSQPMLFQDFRRDEGARRRYWARSFVGWPRVAEAMPNDAHRMLSRLESAGFIHQLVSQNVDGLHQRAGSRRVIELHGSISRVDCLGCRLRMPRSDMQVRLAAANPWFTVRSATMAPDGDALIATRLGQDFQVPDCPDCGGILKPAVVFFGENVPRPRVELAYQRLRQANLVLGVGSSLTVYSGFRFCREAAALGTPIALVNRGRTRADDLATVKLDEEVGNVLRELSRRLT